MAQYDLSILIPARNEMFLSNTVENIVANKRGNTEVIVGLDGQWSNPPIIDHSDVTIYYSPVSLGQRAMTNQLCRMSKAKYVMKLDAHCALDEGFDVKLLADMQDDWTVIPAMYNLHAFDWVCKTCGARDYQGPSDKYKLCPTCGAERQREIIFQPRLNRRSEFYRFDTTLHFQYHSDRKKHPDAQGDIAETMSAQGSCFMLTRDKYWELNISDEKHGSWGQQGVEVALKTWLSGGRLVTNKRTWYAHMFRTQGGDFGFPYPISGKQVDHARNYSKDIWFNNKFEKQIYPLSWLIEKFKPLPDWHEESGKNVLDMVNQKGKEFYNSNPNFIAKVKRAYEVINSEPVFDPDGGISYQPFTITDMVKNVEPLACDEQGKVVIDTQVIQYITKGIIYYTDNQVPLKIGHAARKTIKRAGLPIVSASLKAMDFGTNIHLKGFMRGYEAYFRQILAALESSTAEIIYFCEHDWLYHPSHFDFTPPKRDVFYYNWNWWRVRASDGLAVHYDTQLLPGIVAYKDILVEHYRNVVAYLEKEGFTAENANRVGFEPGTHGRVAFANKYTVERFDSAYPIIDIRHDTNLTSSKWSQNAFRSQKNCQGWVEKDASEIEGWQFMRGNFIRSLLKL